MAMENKSYECKTCNYKTHVKYHFSRHLTTKKHILNLGDETTIDQKNICIFCKKIYSRFDALTRHLNTCDKKFKKNQIKNVNTINNSITNNNNNGVINNGDVNNNISINILSNKNKEKPKKRYKSKIDMLNENYEHVIPLAVFAKNIDLHTEECNELILHYAQDIFANKKMYNKRYVHALKAESYRQHFEKGLIDEDTSTAYPTFVLPICSGDITGRTITIKGANGWITTSSDKHIIDVFGYVNSTIFRKKKDTIPMTMKETNNLIRCIKKENPIADLILKIDTTKQRNINNINLKKHNTFLVSDSETDDSIENNNKSIFDSTSEEEDYNDKED